MINSKAIKNYLQKLVSLKMYDYDFKSMCKYVFINIDCIQKIRAKQVYRFEKNVIYN